MFKKIIISAFMFFYAQIVFSETCPSIVEIKNHYFHHWTAYDSDNGMPLSKKQIYEFIKKVSQFSMAEYAQGAPEGANHCYYGDNNNQFMFAFLAKEGLTPDTQAGNWQNQGGFLRCHGDVNECPFK